VTGGSKAERKRMKRISVEELQVRPACSEDASVLERISKESLSEYWKEQDFLEAISGGHADVVITTFQNEPVGYLILYHVADEGEIPGVAVTEQMRGCGAGNLLLQEALRIGSSYNLRKIFLEVRESNKPAIGLYEAGGFLQVGRRRNFYKNPGEDALLYAYAMPEGVKDKTE